MGIAGAGLSLALVPRFLEVADAQTGLLLLFVTHGAIFGGIAVAARSGLAVGARERRFIVRCVIGGVVGALIGTFVFEVINFVAFPLLRMYEPVPFKALPRFDPCGDREWPVLIALGLAGREPDKHPSRPLAS